MKSGASDLVGQVFNGMYRIVRPIGTGGMGAVFEAVHTRLAQKKFAIKMLHAAIAQDQEVFQRFRREAEIATELGHPNIVEVHDFNITPEGAPYMVMEFLEGEDLASRLAKRGPMHLEQMARIVAEICSGLAAAHDAGIVHRDLKPQNIFLCKKAGRDDFVKIVDFGISKVKDSSSVVTRDHSLMGTPFYMSPEQADGLVQQIDHRTDIFALGAILWEMLTGRMAFEAPTISGAMYKVVHVDPPEVHLMRPDVPAAVSSVLRRALAKQKQSRYDTVTELGDDFARARTGQMPAVTPPPLNLGTMPPHVAVVPRPATPLPVSNPEAFAATGYVAPAPGTAPPVSQMPATAVPSAPTPINLPPPVVTPPSVSTLSHAAAQVAPHGMAPPPAKKSKAPLFAGLGVVAVLGVGAAVALQPKSAAPVVARQPEPEPVKKEEPPPAPPPPAPAPEPVKVEAPAPSPPPAPAMVKITFDVQYKKGDAPGKPAPVILLDGKPVAGHAIDLEKGTTERKVSVTESGYRPAAATVVPDGDKTVVVTLKKKSSGTQGPSFDKLWQP